MNAADMATIKREALKDALALYNDCEQPETLSPETYDGDAEGFAFDWADDRFGGELVEADKESALEIYLESFWAEIERLQTLLEA